MRVVFAVLPAVLALTRLPRTSAHAQALHSGPNGHHGPMAPKANRDESGVRVSLGASVPLNSLDQALHTGWTGRISRRERMRRGFSLETAIHAFQHEGAPNAERAAAAAASLERMDFSMQGFAATANLTHRHRHPLVPGLRKRAIGVTAGVGMYRFSNATAAEYQNGDVYRYTNRLNEMGYNVGASLDLTHRRSVDVRYHRVGRGANAYGFLPISLSTRF